MVARAGYWTKILKSYTVKITGVEGRRCCSKGTQMTPGDIGGSGDGGPNSLKPKKHVHYVHSKSEGKTSSVVLLQVMKYPITIPLRIWVC